MGKRNKVLAHFWRFFVFFSKGPKFLALGPNFLQFLFSFGLGAGKRDEPPTRRCLLKIEGGRAFEDYFTHMPVGA